MAVGQNSLRKICAIPRVWGYLGCNAGIKPQGLSRMVRASYTKLGTNIAIIFYLPVFPLQKQELALVDLESSYQFEFGSVDLRYALLMCVWVSEA